MFLTMLPNVSVVFQVLIKVTVSTRSKLSDKKEIT